MKEDLVKQFDSMTKELYGDFGFSEIIYPNELHPDSNNRRKRIGYTRLDANMFEDDLVNDFQVQPLEVVMCEESRTEIKDPATLVRLYVDFTELHDSCNARELMLNYTIKKVFKYFPDANYDLDSDDKLFLYIFNLN